MDAGDCLEAAIAILDQGTSLLQRLTDEAYCQRLGVASNASIGGHYRHCLDHFRCLLRGADTGLLDYDARDRDLGVEQRRDYALKATEELRAALLALPKTILESEIRVRCKVHYVVDRTQQVASSMVREVMYVVAHAVHHFALIAIMSNVMGLQVPTGFGVAPSTLQHRAKALAPAEALA